jgi:D-alanyl-D-alanine carboxypeptidase
MNSTYMSFRERPPAGVAVSHRYESREDLTGVPHQSADWAGGGLVSTAGDLARFILGLVRGELFGKETNDILDMMLQAVPTEVEGVGYGLGVFVIDAAEEGLGRVWGHDGWCNSFMFFSEGLGLAATGTLNQLDNDWYEHVSQAALLASREMQKPTS